MFKMQYLKFISYVVMLLLYFGVFCRAFDCKRNEANPLKVASTVTVDKTGKGKFRTVQSAIDSIPSRNSYWIRVQISPGVYKEKVTIPEDKTCIFLEGAGSKLTSIEWAGHENTAASTTFTSLANNIVAKGITFKNNYNHPISLDEVRVTQAVAARIVGDKSAFYLCRFVGVQDTLWDDNGRHYFYKCYIQGGIDFIFGNGQSIYEQSVINYSMANYGIGYITANGRNSADDPSGYVFKNCKITGTGQVYLGRAWRAFSRVIFANSILPEAVIPDGWNAWHYATQENRLTFAESNCSGPGSDTSKRVPWLKKMSKNELSHFLHISFIDQEGWIANLPTVF